MSLDDCIVDALVRFIYIDIILISIIFDSCENEINKKSASTLTIAFKCLYMRTR